MFEDAEKGTSLSRAEYKAAVPALRAELLNVQFDLKNAGFPVIILVSGVDGAGKGDVVHHLTEWLDPRGVETHAFWETSDEERERPEYWRFWRAMPPKGQIGILFGSWYTNPIILRVRRTIDTGVLDRRLDHITAFERMLTDDGALLIKLWFHMSKEAQYQRLRQLEKDRHTRGKVTPTDWKHHKMYDRFLRISEHAIRRTDAAHAPWTLIEAVDANYREIETGRVVLKALQERLQRPPTKATAPAERIPAIQRNAVLDAIDLSPLAPPQTLKQTLRRHQGKLSRLAWKARRKKVSVVGVFEGWDAAGKGGAIRRVTHAMDPRLFRVVPIAAPNDEERAQHYLWRFWRQLPRAGKMTLFDRSWYGRVLVERVEGFAQADEWQRAYQEINAFEEELTDHGIVLLKFWLHISKDEQLQRFEARKDVAYKRHKITDEDWRNREQWDAYELAVTEMVERTSTDYAPWTLVGGNDKRSARVQVVQTFTRALKKALG